MLAFNGKDSKYKRYLYRGKSLNYAHAARTITIVMVKTEH